MSSQISYPWRLQLILVSPLISDPPEFSSPRVCWGGGGGHIFCRLQMASLLLAPPPPPKSAWRVLLCSCLHWKALFRPVIFTCTLCVALVDFLVSRVGSSLTSSTFVPGGWVVLSSCYVRNCLFVGFAIRVSSSDSAPLFRLVSVELWLPPPCSFLTPWCLRDRSCCSTSSFSVCGLCF